MYICAVHQHEGLGAALRVWGGGLLYTMHRMIYAICHYAI